MSNEAFADAARQAPPRILRVPLLPYSIGHEILLLRERNPLLSYVTEFKTLPDEVKRFSILRAIQICSRTWEQNKRCDRWTRFWGWVIRRDNFPLAIADFRNYRIEGSTFPNIKETHSDESRTLGAPLISRLLDYAFRACGESAYDQPIGLIQWLYFAQAEYDGGCQVENALERQIREEKAQFEEEYRKEQEAKRCQH